MTMAGIDMDTLEYIRQELNAFYKGQVDRLLSGQAKPDIILLVDPNTSTATAGLSVVFNELQKRRPDVRLPIVAAVDLGFGTYYDLLREMQNQEVGDHTNTAMRGGYVDQSQQDFFAEQLKTGDSLTDLNDTRLEILTGLSHRPVQENLRVEVVYDIDLPEDPRLELAEAFVRSLSTNNQVQIESTIIFPALGEWQPVTDEFTNQYVARRYANRDNFTPEVLSESDQQLAAQLRSYAEEDIACRFVDARP